MKLVPTTLSRVLAAALVTCAATACGSALAWEADSSDKLQRRSLAALESFESRMPKIEPYFEQAYGYAILPSVKRIGAGFGWAWGRGLVVEQDRLVARTRLNMLTTGIQAGFRVVSVIVFFKDKQAFDYYAESKLQFMGQAGVAAGPVGANADPAYNRGVALFTLTKGGLMGEATVAGAHFSYKPL